MNKWKTLVLPLAAAGLIADAQAETFVQYQKITSGPELEEAVAFLSTYLVPDDYNTAKWFKESGYARFRKLGNTLDLYVREFVRLAKADVNDDGTQERFYFFSDSRRCGSIGCDVLVVATGSRGGRLLCSVSGGAAGFAVTDRVTIHGWHELRFSFDVYWHDGDTCDEDIPGGDGYQPPRRDPLRP